MENKSLSLVRRILEKRMSQTEEVEQIDEMTQGKSYSQAQLKKKIESGNWEATQDIKPGKHVEFRHHTGKRVTVHVKEEFESLLEYPSDLAKMKKVDSYKVGDKIYTKVGGAWRKGHITSPLNKAGNYGVQFHHNGKSHSYVSAPHELRLHVEAVELEEAAFASTMKKAIAAHDRGDSTKAKYHLDNAKTARYAMKSTEISKHKDLLDKYKELRGKYVSEEVEIVESDNYIIHATVDGKTKTFRVRGASSEADAKKKFEQHHATTPIVKVVKEEVELDEANTGDKLGYLTKTEREKELKRRKLAKAAAPSGSKNFVAKALANVKPRTEEVELEEAEQWELKKIHAEYQAHKATPTATLLKKHQARNRVSAKYSAAEVGGKEGLISDLMNDKHGQKRMAAYHALSKKEKDALNDINEGMKRYKMEGSLEKWTKDAEAAGHKVVHHAHKTGDYNSTHHAINKDGKIVGKFFNATYVNNKRGHLHTESVEVDEGYGAYMAAVAAMPAAAYVGAKLGSKLHDLSVKRAHKQIDAANAKRKATIAAKKQKQANEEVELDETHLKPGTKIKDGKEELTIEKPVGDTKYLVKAKEPKEVSELSLDKIKAYAKKAMSDTIQGKKDRNAGMKKAYSRIAGTDKPLSETEE